MSWKNQKASLSQKLSGEFLKDIECGKYTAVALEVRRWDEEPLEIYLGHHGDLKMTVLRRNSFFDLASLTKILFPTSFLLLEAQGGLDLSQDVREVLSDLPWNSNWKKVAVEDLLLHQAGFAPWKDLFVELYQGDSKTWSSEKDQAKGRILKNIAQDSPIYDPRSKVEYSDLGFILLGEWMERFFEKSLSELWEQLSKKLGSEKDLLFNPVSGGIPKEKTVSTEEIPWRGSRIQGEVHDGNTFLMGGVSVHAGLFGTFAATSRWAFEWMAGYKGKSRHFDREAVLEFSRLHTAKGLEPRGLGWMKPSRPFSTGGRRISEQSVGHLGYTGTSIWIDLKREIQVVFLTNRVHGSTTSEEMGKIRARVHDQIWDELS